MNSTLWCINKLLPSPKREEPMRIKKEIASKMFKAQKRQDLGTKKQKVLLLSREPPATPPDLPC